MHHGLFQQPYRVILNIDLHLGLSYPICLLKQITYKIFMSCTVCFDLGVSSATHILYVQENVNSHFMNENSV